MLHEHLSVSPSCMWRVHHCLSLRISSLSGRMSNCHSSSLRGHPTLPYAVTNLRATLGSEARHKHIRDLRVAGTMVRIGGRQCLVWKLGDDSQLQTI